MLTWHNANGAPILYVAPVFYGLLFLAGSLPISFAVRRWPGIDWERFYLSFLAGVAGYCLATLDGLLFSTTTSIILAVAAATVTFRALHADRQRLHRLVDRTLVPGIVAPGILAVLVTAGTSLLEAWRIHALPAAAADRPNVILLVMDTERADHLSAYGYLRPTSRRLDALASQGVLFEEAYAPAPWTLPSHASIMTGRFPEEHGAGTRTLWNLDGSYLTLAEALDREGYATGGFVSNLFWTGRSTGLNRGFIHYKDYFGNLSDAVNRTVFGRVILFPAIDALARESDIPGRRRAREINGDMLRWIDQVDGHPFFAFANYNDVHQPYRPTNGTKGTFGGDRDAESEHGLQIGAWDEDQSVPPAPIVQNRIDRYDESLLGMDQAIGALLDSLEARKLLERTLIIVVADHGEQFGEHGFMGHGQSLHREELRVPLIIKDIGPGKPGVRVATPVSTVDIAATVAQRTGLAANRFPGRSLLGSHPGRPGPVRSELTTRTRPNGFRSVKTGGALSLIEGEWHLIAHESGDAELYNRLRDPEETQELSDSVAYFNTVARMQQSLGRPPYADVADQRPAKLPTSQATIMPEAVKH